MLKNFLKFISGILFITILTFLYFLYQANVDSSRDRELARIEGIASNSQKITSKEGEALSPELEEFILKVVVRGLPRLKLAQENCVRKLRDELSFRKLNLPLLAGEEQKAKEIRIISERHQVLFAFTKDSLKIAPSKYFFSQLKDEKKVPNKFLEKVPRGIFLRSLQRYKRYSNCFPEGLRQNLEALLGPGGSKVAAELRGIPAAIRSPLDPTDIHMRLLGVNGRKWSPFRDLPEDEHKLLVDFAREIEDKLSRPLDIDSYKRIDHLQMVIGHDLALYSKKKHAKRVKRKEKNQKESKKFNTKRSSKDSLDKKKFKEEDIVEKFKKMKPEDREKLLAGMRAFAEYMRLEQNELDARLAEEEVDSVEYGVGMLATLAREAKDFFKGKAFDVLDIDKDTQDHVIATKTLSFLTNMGALIKTSPKSDNVSIELSSEEEQRYQELMDELEANSSVDADKDPQ